LSVHVKAHGPYTWKLRNYFDKSINDQEEDKDNPPKVNNSNKVTGFNINRISVTRVNCYFNYIRFCTESLLITLTKIITIAEKKELIFGAGQFDPKNQIITLTLITLGDFHSSSTKDEREIIN
jgi:hypothetical protein